MGNKLLLEIATQPDIDTSEKSQDDFFILNSLQLKLKGGKSQDEVRKGILIRWPVVAFFRIYSNSFALTET